MFAKLFAEGGLSLDRLRALLEVNAAGSIVKAAGGDPVRQSQFSRQIKELEDFFQVKLAERHGKGIRLTSSGRELARISRFFLLGLSNFRRGCLAEEQTFRIGASATVVDEFTMPLLASACGQRASPRYAVGVFRDDEIESRLHDLTLDFGVVTKTAISRPLQLRVIGRWDLVLWIPRTLNRNGKQALVELNARRLPLAIASEMPPTEILTDYQPRLECGTFAELRTALRAKTLAAVLPMFLHPGDQADFRSVKLPRSMSRSFQYQFAWNPQLLRLNPHAIRVRDFLVFALSRRMREASAVV